MGCWRDECHIYHWSGLQNRPLLRVLRFRRARWKREIKSGSLSNHCMRPDTPAVPVNNALHGSQPDAGTFKFGARMQALERAKELVGIGHVESHSIVAHKKTRFSLVMIHAELYVRMFAF